jgi:hypothetical protein
MCEFTVFEESNPAQKIADDIVKARTKNGALVISKVMGESLTLKDSMILEVNVSKEQMLISQSPLVGNFTALVDSISEFRKHPSRKLYDEIVSAWGKAKSQGDSLIKSLKTKE